MCHQCRFGKRLRQFCLERWLVGQLLAKSAARGCNERAGEHEDSMRQVLQDMSNGRTWLVEAPAPGVSAGNIIIRTTKSLISAGTERMLVDFGKASLISKARKQPEKVKQVLNKVRTDGLGATVDAVRSKLGQPLPLGYCNVGVVQAVGQGADGFRPGDRVASNGPHADTVKVPKNLCVKIPDTVDDEAAAFTVVGSIGLQGIRLAQPTLGEAFVVTGAGLIGLMTVQLLMAQGCRVLAIDFDEAKLELARAFGAQTCNPAKGEDPVAAGMSFSRGLGVDGVIITASTDSNQPVEDAAKMCRKRGRIVLVGVTGLALNRADFYEKELSFQVSCSYGPGRYDTAYEQGGQDYPAGFVRWTEKRNFEAILDMMASGRIDVRPLISRQFSFDDVPAAYQALTEDRSALGIILNYAGQPEARQDERIVLNTMPMAAAGKAVVGFIGAGNFGSRILIPAFKACGAQLKVIATSSGVSGVIHGERAGFGEAVADTEMLLQDTSVNTVAIVTRHDSHAPLTAKALAAGKNVFVEKPLAITTEQLDMVRGAWGNVRTARLMVGFNRRFAPHSTKFKALLDTVKEPKSFIMTVNAGAIPADHWTQDKNVGGGRIIGEACHFIDLMRFFAGTKITSVKAVRMGDVSGLAEAEDKAAITLTFADGSFGTIHYLANGAQDFPKERIEAFAAGRVLQIDNFRTLRAWGWPGFAKMSLWRQDKGHRQGVAAFINAIETGAPTPIPVEELFEVAAASIEAAEQLRNQ
jgi:predicted dehydrogenase/threonine dehydrogenase-like Zn-dependent dehydrogenase